MTGDEVRLIRERLSKEIGRHVSQQEFGKGFGLAHKNAGDTMRRWELIGPSAPAAVALGYLRQGLETTLPEFIKGKVAEDDGSIGAYIVRLHWPRAVATLNADGIDRIEWIDDPKQFGDDLADHWAFKDAPIF